MPIREPQAGEILNGQYHLNREIGRGGFGVVFEATHLHLGRIVAIKALLAASTRQDPNAKERFRREARITSSLNYPNSLRIHDYGETEDGIFYLVMEYVRGEELSKACVRIGPFPPQRALHIIRQVLYALSEAHNQGITHRDVKPENVMICPLSYTEDFVKVMDFGIAKMHSAEQLTQEGLSLGTPRYMPVEQLRGHELGPSTDIYAVGLVLYEMLSGRDAYKGDSVMDIVTDIIRGRSFSVPADLKLPGPLVHLIERATRKEAHERFQNAGEFLAAIAQVETQLSAASAPLAHADTQLVSHEVAASLLESSAAAPSASPTPVVSLAPAPASVPAPMLPLLLQLATLVLSALAVLLLLLE